MMNIESLRDVLGAKAYNWYLDDSITDSAETALRDGAIRITDHIKRSQWLEFESKLEGIGKSLIVITDGLPREWIKNKKLKVLRTQIILRKFLKKFDNHFKNYQFKHFNRRSCWLEYDFFCMYGRQEYHREIIVKELESRAVFDKSLYSRPTVDDRPGRSIETDKTDAPLELRFNHVDNFEIVVKNSQRCCCHLVLENNGFFSESDSTITEKSIWPIFSQVPFVWALAPNKYRQLTDWGFKPNDAPRKDLRSLCEQLLWLKTEFADQDRSQRWQDNQGETINHNFKILKGLPDRIDEENHEQLSILGLANYLGGINL